MSTDVAEFTMATAALGAPAGLHANDVIAGAAVLSGLSPIAKLSAAANEFRSLLWPMEGATQRPDPITALELNGVVWKNLILETAVFRRIHVEEFGLPGRIQVLHVCLVPRVNRNCPIFGFDAITGHSRPTGAFLDLSPVDRTVAFPSLWDLLDEPHRESEEKFGRRRSLPEWGEIFSDEVIAVAPDGEGELAAVLTAALHLLNRYLQIVQESRPVSTEAQKIIIKGQQKYCLYQRKNEHTYRVLSRIVGDRTARHFIDETLFPLPDISS